MLSKAELHSYQIVGAYYRAPAQAILSVLPSGTRLLLRHAPVEPNPNFDGDPNAIAVFIEGSVLRDLPDSAKINLIGPAADVGFQVADILSEQEIQLGYIPAKSAKKLKLTTEILGELHFGFDGKHNVRFIPK